MSTFNPRGPENPSAFIFATTAMFGATIGMVTVSWAWFFLAMLGSASLQCAIYVPLRRWLAWKPLDFAHLSHLVLLLFPH